MRRFLIVILALATAVMGLALARDMVFFTVDDTGFDYTDTEIEEAYLQLAFKEGNFEVMFGDSEMEAALPAISITVPKRVDTDDYGNETVTTALKDLIGIEWYESGSEILGFEVTHADVDLETVSDAYFAAFEAAGFAMVEETTDTNLVACVFGDGVYQLRTVLTRRGQDIVAYLHTS
jgi:hypothetical protein